MVRSPLALSISPPLTSTLSGLTQLLYSLVTGPPDVFLILYFSSWLDADMSFLQGPVQAPAPATLPTPQSLLKALGPGGPPPSCSATHIGQGRCVEKAPDLEAEAVHSGPSSLFTALTKLSGLSETGIIYKKRTESILPVAQNRCDEEYVKTFCGSSSARPGVFPIYSFDLY